MCCQRTAPSVEQCFHLDSGKVLNYLCFQCIANDKALQCFDLALAKYYIFVLPMFSNQGRTMLSFGGFTSAYTTGQSTLPSTYTIVFFVCESAIFTWEGTKSLCINFMFFTNTEIPYYFIAF